MILTDQLTQLKLQQSFIKELDQEDFDFAQKQYKKIYASQMSKLSSKIERIQRVKRNLQDIETQETIKLKEKKESLNKKYEFIEKNKQKYITQKIQTYKIHHEMWEHKITDIKKKNKEYMRSHADKSKKYKDDAEKFWKTKTEELFASVNKKNPHQRQRNFSTNQKSSLKRSQKLNTQGAEQTLLGFKRQNTNNSKLHQNNHSTINVKDSQIDAKTIRFVTDNSKLSRQNTRRKNESNFSNKFSLHSFRDESIYHMESKKSVKMPHLEQNRFSQNLSPGNKVNISYDFASIKKFSTVDNLSDLKINLRNQLLAEKCNFSFQKAMKKLDKIHKLKEKNIRKLQPTEKTLSPCKPRKSIDPQQYRQLRAKSEAKKPRKNHPDDTTENLQAIQPPSPTTKPHYPAHRTIRHHTTSQPRQTIAFNTVGSRLSLLQSRTKLQQQKAKERDMILEGQMKKWKKEKIVKAIKEKVFKIKLGEIQKVKERKAMVVGW